MVSSRIIKMKKIFRILIAFVIGIISLGFSIALYLTLFEEEQIASTFGVATAVAVMFFTYKNLPATKKELLEQNTKLIETHYPNGITKERGKMVYGKKDGEWEYYNEAGALIKEDIYNDGLLTRTVDHLK